jgi:large subunit ribosomal protein L29
MKASDLREKSLADLIELRKSLAGERFQNRLKNFTNRLDDTSSIRKARRDLARVFTIIRQLEARAAGSVATATATAPAPTPAPSPPTAASPPKEAKVKSTAKKAAKSETAPLGSTKKSTKKKSEASSR